MVHFFLQPILSLANIETNILLLGMMSAAASQGLIWRWDIDTGLAQCDRFLYVNDEYIKVLRVFYLKILVKFQN